MSGNVVRRNLSLAIVLLVVSACGSASEPSGVPLAPPISAGDGFACSLDGRGSPWCWGKISWTSEGFDGKTPTPQRVDLPTELRFQSLDAGAEDVCALTLEGDAWCWGLTPERRPNTTEEEVTGVRSPSAVAMPAGVKFTSISSGWSHVCAIGTDEAAWCWGNNFFGQLGDGSTADSLVPVRVLMPEGERLRAVAAGELYTCAITFEGSAWCWGYWYGDRWAGTFRQSEPEQIGTSPSVRFSAISASWSHTCALAEDGSAWCWGTGSWALFGMPADDSTGGDVTSPVRIAGDFTEVSTGRDFTCALTTAGGVVCWGGSVPSLRGFEMANYRSPVPVAMPDDLRFVSVSAGGDHICSRSSDGSDWCWGANAYGQTGDGTRVDRYEPVAVLRP